MFIVYFIVYGYKYLYVGCSVGMNVINVSLEFVVFIKGGRGGSYGDVCLVG